MSRQETTLGGSDELAHELGGQGLRLEVVQSPDPTAPGAVLSSDKAREQSLGRDVAFGLSLRDPRLSRVHLNLSWDARQAGFRLNDAGSANGTFVNGRRVERCLLMPDDVVRAGDTLLVCVERDLAAEVRARAQRAARSMLPLVILGETGSGKELLARAVHEASGRRGDFVAVNCAALPLDLAATELFGHTRGAFSGATAGREGLFRSAEGGTLLLDEIGDLPLDLQGHLLRALQESRIRPVGADREVAIDVRVIAATHVDLAAAVKARRFRADLSARLEQLTLTMPPLRARRSEILRLVAEFAPELTLTASAAEALLCWEWPGNVRELRALTLSHAALRIDDKPVRARDLAPRLPSAQRVLAREPASESSPPERDAIDRRRQLDQLLQRHDGNITEVARELGKPRAQIYRWLRALGMSRGSR